MILGTIQTLDHSNLVGFLLSHVGTSVVELIDLVLSGLLVPDEPKPNTAAYLLGLVCCFGERDLQALFTPQSLHGLGVITDRNPKKKKKKKELSCENTTI